MKLIILSLITLATVFSQPLKATTCAKLFETSNQITKIEELTESEYQSLVELATAQIEAEAITKPHYRNARLLELEDSLAEVLSHGIPKRLFFEIKSQVASGVASRNRTLQKDLAEQVSEFKKYNEQYIAEAAQLKADIPKLFGSNTLSDGLIRMLANGGEFDQQYFERCIKNPVLKKEIISMKPSDSGLDFLLDAAIGYKSDLAVKFLLENGVDIGGLKGETALLNAAHWDHEFAARVLLEAGVNKEAIDANGNTVLHKAAGHIGPGVSVLKLLLAAKVNVEAVNNNGDTPLHSTALWDRGAAVKMLLEAGARTDITNKDGKTALDIARVSLNEYMIELLKKAGAQK